jgi:iron complex transport system permease protein
MDTRIKFVILTAAAVCSVCAGVLIGSVNIPLPDAFGVIFGGVREGGTAQIIWNIRLPRVVLAFCVGGSLSVGGAVVQSALKNPLASPYTMGVSSGAAFAIGLLTVLGVSIPLLGIFFMPAAGFAAGMSVIAAVLFFASRIDKNMGSSTLVLTGIIFAMFFTAAQTVIVSIAAEDIRRIVLFASGSFAMRGWPFVYAVLPFFLLGTAAVMLFTRELDVLTLGDEQAKASGVESKRVTVILLLISAVLAGASVAVAGVIGFVDLATPHLARKVFGSRHILVIPASLLAGGSLMVLADLLARTVASPSEIPVGAVTALIGAPFFAWLFLKRK